MELDKFFDDVFGNVMSQEGIEKAKRCIIADMGFCGVNYYTTKVEFQVFDKDNNYDTMVNITNEEYSDGEVIFIDCHLD